MRLAVITPVGPGHERFAQRAIDSVNAAKKVVYRFDQIEHVVIEDHRGVLGRSRARNQGMVDADWYFFLDADDTMLLGALTLNEFKASATFGAVSLEGSIMDKNVWPCGWPEIAKHGARGTLSMGFFCRAQIARALKFNEDMNAGEDFDFYMRLPDFVKIKRPLVDIGYSLPSAGGPRGYREIDWTGICNKVIKEKYDFSGDAVLEKTRRASKEFGRLS